MGITEESTEKVISVSFQAASVTADLLLKVLQSLEDAMKRENQGKNMFNTEQGRQVEVKTGKMNLHDLSGKGPTDYIDISNKKDFKNIERQCKKHNIDYSVLKSKDSPPTYSIFFQTKDTNILKKMLGEAIKDIEKDLQEQEQEQEQAQEQAQEQEEPEQEQSEQEQKDQEQEQKDQEQEQSERGQKDQEQEQPEQEQKDQEQ
ncbi:MAG: PcfB family protein [Lachnospiraceae bacterium]|nr:PcfB family protein [Lachnospiraceae bacterium]